MELAAHGTDDRGSSRAGTGRRVAAALVAFVAIVALLAACELPESIEVSDVTSSSVSITWEVPERFETDLSFTYGLFVDGQHVDDVLASAGAATVTDLAPSTSYVITLQWLYKGDWTVHGPSLTVETAPHPTWRGPEPTVASAEAALGPFEHARTTVPSSVSGFGGGTIYYPTDTSQGDFGAVAIVPGFTGEQSAVSWLGPRLASNGFVVITIDTNSGFDLPGSRGTQLQAALDYLVGSSPVRDRIDPDRLAVMGHSMGGGGALAAAQNNPALQAAVPLAPFHTDWSWGGVSVPTLIVGAQNDVVAQVNLHAERFYSGLPSTLDRAYLEIAGGSHSVVTSPNVPTAVYSIAWLKRFVDDDTRYEPFLCGAPHDARLASGVISEYRDTCPHG